MTKTPQPPDEVPPTGAQVLAVFAELTGIDFRRPSDQVLRQATIFGETFTFAELEAVIEFMRWQVKHEMSGYNAASFGWRRLMGDHGASDEFQTFEERLGLARDAVKRKAWYPKLRFKDNTRIAASDRTAASADKPQPVSPEEQARLAAQAREAMKNFKL
jgi:hypothetical protein